MSQKNKAYEQTGIDGGHAYEAIFENTLEVTLSTTAFDVTAVPTVGEFQRITDVTVSWSGDVGWIEFRQSGGSTVVLPRIYANATGSFTFVTRGDPMVKLTVANVKLQAITLNNVNVSVGVWSYSVPEDLA